MTARSKGKVERPFRTVKEAHETLYHFHTPQNEAEANLWLRNYLVRYNAQPHRSEPRSRAEDWSSPLPEAGLRAMCAWDRFRTFAREPERRRVGIDARVQVDGVSYEVDPSLAGETVTLWWGLFDHELFVEHADQRFGPFGPIDGPIPLHRYRSFRKSPVDERLDRIEALAGKLGLPRAALEGPAPIPAYARRRSRPRCRSTTRTRSGNCASPASSPPSSRSRTISAAPGEAGRRGSRLHRGAAQGDAGAAHHHHLRAGLFPRPCAGGKERTASMRAEVMEFYGLTRSPRAVGYYETAHHRQLLQDIKQAVYDGDLVALCGVVGAGKTVTLRRLQEMLARENRVIVSKSISVEKSRVTLGTLITALFCDLSPDKEPKIPKQGELRERELRNLVRKRKKPIVLMVDEAHDLHHHTLTGLKRLIEMVADGDGKLCVLLAGHPKLRRDLRSPTMEEIGYRTAVFSLEGVTGSQREYIEWMLATCAADKAKVDDILDPAAVDLLASRLRTPLQIEQHLTLALETGYQASEKPVGEAIVELRAVQADRRPGADADPARLHGEGADRDAGHETR